jgi:hypothetical protein
VPNLVPVIPVGLQATLTLIRSRLARGERLGSELDRALDFMRDLAPEQIGRIERAIAERAGLGRRAPEPLLSALFRPRLTDLEQLLRTPRLECLFLFHRDGRLREVALQRLTGGLPSPFLFAAVAWRLNDWAQPVRQAAASCARRCFPLTSPDVVARCAVLLVRRLSWGRWGEEREILDEAFGREDVATRLADLIIGAATGPLAAVLRAALRTRMLDPHLQRISSDAMQPSVRALALDTLINGKAEWPSGYTWQWVDKSMGKRHRVAVHDTREISVAVDRKALIDRGAGDKSAVVRRVALTGVIRHLRGAPEARGYAGRLLADRSRPVRERAEFIMRTESTGG